MSSATRKIQNAVVESLEQRRLLSSVTYANGEVIIEGHADQPNVLNVQLDRSGLRITAQANDVTRSYLVKNVKLIRIVGGEMDDFVYVDNRLTIRSYIRTGAGNDTIYGGGGSDTILAGHGDDFIFGRGGDDLIIPGPGRDRIDAGPGDDPTSIARRKTRYPAAVQSFTLIDADRNVPVPGFESLRSGATINLAELPTRNLNIVANVGGVPAPGSVVFTFDAVDMTKLENVAPYALAGNDGSNFFRWTPSTGTHVLEATPYSESNGRGRAGVGQIVWFTVVDVPVTPEAPAPENAQGGKPAADPSANPTPLAPSQTHAPIAAIELIADTIAAGHAVHVTGVNSKLHSGTPLNARYEWDFGDPTSSYNTLRGFNAAHVYHKPGTYTVTLRVTDDLGRVAVATAQVTVAPAGRMVLYVSNSGNDNNSGASPTAPIKTFARAAQLAGNDTEILFKRGETFELTKSMNAGYRNLVIGAYGTGARPVLKYTGSSTYATIINTGTSARDVTIRGLAFDGVGTAIAHTTLPTAIRAGGTNITILDNLFLNVCDAINSNLAPRGVLAQDNAAPLGGLRGYFAWVQGSDHVYLGNKVDDSLYVHVLRSAGLERMLIAHNDFTNIDQPVMKATLNIQKGQFIYVTDNRVTQGRLAVGPLNNGDGLADKDGRTRWVVVENNRVRTQIEVHHGTEHLMVRNNTVYQDHGTAIQIHGFNNTYGRGVADVYVLNNTAINAGTHGRFLRVDGSVGGITLANNLYVAPNLVVGPYNAAPVYISGTDLSSFRLVSNNIWPAAQSNVGGGIQYVGSSYCTPDKWESFEQVVNDVFQHVMLSISYQVSLGGMTAGAAMARGA